MLTVNPYLGFDGNCEDAIESYRSIVGGELEFGRFSEMPPGTPVDPGSADTVMHVSLPLGDGQVLMGSDRPPGMGTTTFGDSVAVSASPVSAEDGRRIFEPSPRAARYRCRVSASCGALTTACAVIASGSDGWSTTTRTPAEGPRLA